MLRSGVQCALAPYVNLAVVADLVKPAGYILEEYTVQTTDGFLLGLYRIPFGQRESAQQARCVVYSSQLCIPVAHTCGTVQSSTLRPPHLAALPVQEACCPAAARPAGLQRQLGR